MVVLREQSEPVAEVDHSVAASVAAMARPSQDGPPHAARLTMRTPTSTYRLQITEDFDLLAAARVLPYLHDLGVDWVYLSPILASEAGSDHGYDVADHSRIDPARGGVAGLAAVSQEARRLGMGVLVDIVPNHVGRRPARGRTPGGGACSRTARRRRTPTPSTSTGPPAAAGCGSRSSATTTRTSPGGPIAHLRVVAGELHYHDQRLPARARKRRRLGRPRVDADVVHARQHYELVSWRVADAGLNYRRFFAVNTLAAIRVEEPRVVRQVARRDRGAGSPRAWSTGCASTIPTACATRRLPRRPRGADRRRLRARREDPRAGRGAAHALGHRRHHRATTCSRWSTGCSPTPPARSR